MNKSNSKKSAWKLTLILMGTFLLTFILIVGGILLYFYMQIRGTVNQMYDDSFENTTSEIRTNEVNINNHDPISIVLFGTDDDSLRNERGMGQRSDTIMVVTLNPNTDHGTIVSIPRDTRTDIIDRGTTEKINHAYAYGGPVMAKRTVENFLEVPIDYFISVNMDSFKEIIDILGSVTVTSQDTFQQSGYSFVAGETYNMDGDMALAFARSRKSDGAGGDTGRQFRQQQVTQAIAEELMSISAITRFNSILSTLGENVQTNVKFDEMNNLRSQYGDSINNLDRLYLEGIDERSSEDGLYYFYPDSTSYHEIRDEMLHNLEMNE